MEQVSWLVREDFDLFFNLCDGAADQDMPGIEVVRVLEDAGVPFTGASSEFYEPSQGGHEGGLPPRGNPHSLIRGRKK